MFFASNIKFLRTRRGKTQTGLAEDLGIKRTSLIGYEKGVQPPFSVMLELSDCFSISVDALLRYDLSKLGEFELSQIEKGFDIDITGSKLRLLVTTVDPNGKENIEMVPHQAQAGYTAGYNDPGYINGLPKFQLPFLAREKTYRCFQISGDSMPPVPEGAWVTASYVQNWDNIKDGSDYIVVTKDDGIVFKRLYNQMATANTLLLVSTNPVYTPYTLPIESIAEIWKMETYNIQNNF